MRNRYGAKLAETLCGRAGHSHPPANTLLKPLEAVRIETLVPSDETASLVQNAARHRCAESYEDAVSDWDELETSLG